jgi:nitrous oxide reductase
MERRKNYVSKSNRRNFMGKSAVVAAGAGVAASTAAVAQEAKPEKRVIHANGKKPDKTPLFSGMVA